MAREYDLSNIIKDLDVRAEFGMLEVKVPLEISGTAGCPAQGQILGSASLSRIQFFVGTLMPGNSAPYDAIYKVHSATYSEIPSSPKNRVIRTQHLVYH